MNMLKLIQQLKDARLAKGLTQGDLGRKLGLPQSHISRIERGETVPLLSTVIDMARLLDLELVLVPRALLPVVRSVVSGKDPQQPMWQPDEDV